jgi:hypothetical protein
MEWLQLYAGSRSPGYRPASRPASAGFLPPAADGTRVPKLSQVPGHLWAGILKPQERFERGCCPLKISFHANAPELQHHEAQVFRIRQHAGGELVGGFTVVLLKP